MRKRSTGGVNVGLLSAAEQTTSNTTSTSFMECFVYLHVIYVDSLDAILDITQLRLSKEKGDMEESYHQVSEIGEPGVKVALE